MEDVSYRSEYYSELLKVIKYKQVNYSQTLNIIDQLSNQNRPHRNCYLIEDDDEDTRDSFFDKLYTMSIRYDGYYCFSEKQNDSPNGVYIDIDIETTNRNKRVMDKNKLKNIISDYMMVLSSLIDKLRDIFDKINVQAFVMQKKELHLKKSNNLDEEQTKKEIYKEGYHIVIPNLHLSKHIRKHILTVLINEFKHDYIDIGPASSPIMFYSNVKNSALMERDKYVIVNEYTISIEKNNISFPCRYNINNIDETLKCDLYDIKKCNIIKELSLTFSKDLLQTHVITEIDHLVKNTNPVNNITRVVNEDSDDNCNIDITNVKDIIKIDLDAKYLYELLDILSPQYYDERNYWWRILCGIYNYSKLVKNNKKEHYNYYYIAQWFSKKSKKYSETDLITQWDSIKRTDNNSITMGSIMYYAKMSDDEKYNNIIKHQDISIIKKEIINITTTRQHYIVCKILKMLIGNKVVHSNGKWYSYLNDLNSGIAQYEAQLNKWVEEDSNVSYTLTKYMSEELTIRISAIKEEYNLQLSKSTTMGPNAKTNLDIELLKNKKKQLNELIVCLGNNPYKTSIMNECKLSLFKDESFYRNLDQNPRTFGVGNGTILLPIDKNDTIVLITGYCPELMTMRYTNICYTPYNEDDKYIEEVLKIISDVIPEPDALEYILIYLSTALSNDMKEPLILLLKGFGSNGKSTLLELMIKTLGDKYSKKLTLGLLTDNRENANSANSAFMDIANARFGYFSEPNKIEKINTGRLKEILGNEQLTGRQIYKKQESFYNKCVMVAAANYDFIINCNDHGIWRRIKFYEFKVKFLENPNPDEKYEKKIDKTLISKKIHNIKYQEAFLSILTKYYDKYVTKYNSDINNVESETIETETKRYRNKYDFFMRFINEKTVIHKNSDYKQNVDIEFLAKEYMQWYGYKYGNIRVDLTDVISTIENSVLGKHIKINDTDNIRYFTNIEFID